MRKAFRYIFLAVALCSLVLSCRKARLIPESTLSKMYADMYMVDQWILKHGELNVTADTMYVYAQLFEKYGYSAEDFNYSVNEYLKNPERYVKVFEGTKSILNKQKKNAELRDSLERKRDSIRIALENRLSKVRTLPLYKDILVGYFPLDTLSPGPDSAKYSLNVPVLDTMFSGPALIIREADTLKVEKVDSLAAEEKETPIRAKAEL